MRQRDDRYSIVTGMLFFSLFLEDHRDIPIHAFYNVFHLQCVIKRSTPMMPYVRFVSAAQPSRHYHRIIIYE